MKRKRTTLGMLLIAFLMMGFVLGCTVPASAQEQEQEPAKVSLEMKFLLNSDKVLKEDGFLNDETIAMLGFENEQYQQIDVVYLETKEKDFFTEGWINRLRQKEGKTKFERTYKKRYSLIEQRWDEIQKGLEQAVADGFNVSSGKFSAEVDWGYSNMTLSISHENDEKHPVITTIDQFDKDRDATLEFFGSAMPEEEDNWKGLSSWGKTTLEKTLTVGPVPFQRIRGSWKGIDEVTIEICPIPDIETGKTTYITELAFKADISDKDGYEAAVAERERLTLILDEKGILEHRDGLKASSILNAYLAQEEEPEKPDKVIKVGESLKFKVKKKNPRVEISDPTVLSAKTKGKKITLTGLTQGTAEVKAYSKKGKELGCWLIKVE